jgi:fibronectin-binding autotransporter adhesin
LQRIWIRLKITLIRLKKIKAMKNIYLLLLSLFILPSLSYSTTYYSIANTGWTTPSTWSTVGCGGAASLTAPGSGDDVVICVGTTVIMDGNAGACNSLTINGTANWTAALTTNVGTGGLTINVGGDVTGSSAGILTTAGGLVLNSTLSSAAVTIKTMTTAGQIISGTGLLKKLDISANTTNNGNITVSSTLASTTLSTLTQGASAVLTYNGSTTVTPNLDASTAGNTVIYGGAAQTVKATTYHHLTISGSSFKTLAGPITINGNLAISASELYTSIYQITGNATGTFTIGATGILTLGNSGSSTNILFPTNFISSNISFNASSTVYYYGNSAQTVSSLSAYGNLIVQNFSGSKTADGNITVLGNLTVISPTTLNMSTYTLNLTGNFSNTGGLSFSSGTFNISGNYTNSGTFTCGTGTVNYNGATQPVRATTYNNLTISGSGQKTIGGAIAVNGNLNITGGSLYTSSFLITGNATGTFTMDAGTALYVGNNGAATDVLFPTNFTTGNISLSSTSTVYYYGNNAQTISSVPAYGNLILQIYSGSKAADGDLTVTGNLTVTSPTTLSMTTHSLNLTLDFNGTGGLTFTSGNFTIGGNFSNSGTFTCGSGTTNYNGGSGQTVRGVNYNNLTFSGAGAKTLQAATTIGIAGNFTRGSMTVTPGATNTVLFNGGAQVMTGSATTFTNLTLNNTSLTAPADFTVTSALASLATLDMSTFTLTVAGNYSGTGALIFSSGTFNLGGNYSNNGAFTCGTGTVNYNGAAGQAVRGVNYNHLTFSGGGAKTLQAAATVGIAGTFTRGTMTVTAGSTNTVLFNGTVQSMTGNATTFVNLTINNTSLTIASDVTVGTTLTFTTGTIITGANNVIISTGGSVARTSGHVVGNLRKNVATGSNVSRTYEIGTGTDYTPLDFVFASVSSAGNLTTSSTTGDHPSIGTSGFNASLTVNRYWTVANSGIVYTTYNVTASFISADEDPSYNTANSIIKIYDGATWSAPNLGTVTSLSTQSLSVGIPTTPNTAYIQIGEIIASSTGNVFSIATGSWSTPGTWSETSGGLSCGCIPTSLDNVYIENNYTVTMNGNVGAGKSLTIQTGGKGLWNSAVTTNIGSGGINITSTGDITGTGAGTLTTSGGLTLNKVLTNTAVTIKLITTAGQTISGTGTMAKLDISANTTNNGNITVSTTLSSAVASTLTQGSSATLTFNGTTAIAPTLDASASGNTVIYNGAIQLVKSTTYHHLTIAGSSYKTLTGAITVNGNLAINASELYTSVYQITGNATGLLTMGASGLLTLGNNGSSINVLFPTNFTAANTSFNSNSTVYYYGASAQTISSVPTYGKLIVQSYSGSKTPDGTINVANNLTVTSPTTLDMGANTLNVTGSFVGTGGLSFTSGTFNLTAAYSNTGSFTCGTGTVNYNGGSAQTIRGVNYNNLTFSGAGAKTLQAAATIGIAGTFTRGTMTVTPGATNIVYFNGAVQNMTGNSTSFTDLHMGNTSLTIASDITVNGVLTFTTGDIITGASTVIIPASGSVSRASGHVEGNLRKNVALGSNVARTFEIGTGTNYTPLDFIFATVSTAGNITASSTATDHPAIATSNFDDQLTVNRYWTVVNSGLVYTTYSVTANFVNADEDAGLLTGISIIRIYNGSTWSTPTAASQLANSTQATGVTIPVTPNTVYLQIGQRTSSTGNVYSIASNNWTNPAIWSETSGGAACSCIPTGVDNTFIENGYTVVMDGNSGRAKSLSISTGGIANWSAAYTTNVGTGGINIAATGDITGSGDGVLTTSGGLTLNASLSSTTVTLQTITTAGQAISGTGSLANLDINVNTTNNGNITLTDVLTITSGTLTNSGTFTLKSDATKYARIAPVLCVGCGFSGNFTIERYIPARSIGTWSDLSSPVSNSTMQDWDDELFMVYPFSYIDPATNRPTNTSVMAYDEPSANYYELSSATTLDPGMGFEIGLTDDTTNTAFSATTLNTIGTPNVGTADIPLIFTAANGPAYPVGYSGENLVGNPFASAVAISGITLTNALSTVDVYDYTIDNYTTLTNTDVLGPHQGFWAYAQGSGASVSIPETAKTTNTNIALYRKATENAHPYLDVTLSSADGSNTMAHTLMIACKEDASDEWDNNDHPFRKSLNPKAPSITANAGEAIVSINTFNNNHETYVMPLNLKIGINGKYQLTTKGIKNVSDYPVVLLEDKLAHTFINLNNSTHYTFSANTADSKQRFALHFSKSLNYTPVSTAIVNNPDKDIQITQNSAGNTINFNLAKTEQTVISVMDLLGKNIVENLNVEANNQSINITLPENFHGLYFITVQSASGRTVKKFVTAK